MEYMGFAKLRDKLGKQRGIKDPGALAAAIGRAKYGKSQFQQYASAGKKMKGVKEG